MHEAWSPPPQSLLLQSAEVHVWRVELEQPDDLLEEFRSTLDVEELHRASRFHFDRHLRAFVVGRGFLRYVLARYLETKPETLRFSYGPHGKPALNGEHKSNRL